MQILLKFWTLQGFILKLMNGLGKWLLMHWNTMRYMHTENVVNHIVKCVHEQYIFW